MNVIDRFLKQYSYRFPKGYPNLTDPSDKKLMQEILSELELDLKHRPITEETELYDKTIQSALNVEAVPAVQGKYSLGANISLSGNDGEIFKRLYPISPPKGGKEVGSAGSKGTGNGEIALYWLFAHQAGHDAIGTQGGDNPDLNIDGVGVEVKAYDTNRMTLGKFGSDKANIELLNTLFGLDALVSSLESKGASKKVSTSTNFNKVDLTNTFNTLRDFSSSDLRELSDKYSLIGNIYAKVDSLLQLLNLESSFDSNEGAAKLLKQILLIKFAKKPGFGGYMANVTENGKISFRKVTEEGINNLSTDDILNNTYINGGAIIINPEGLLKI